MRGLVTCTSQDTFRIVRRLRTAARVAHVRLCNSLYYHLSVIGYIGRMHPDSSRRGCFTYLYTRPLSVIKGKMSEFGSQGPPLSPRAIQGFS